MAERSRTFQVVAAIALGAAYFVAARLSFMLELQQPYATPVWPAAGIALASLLLGGMALWPAITVAAFTSYVVADEPAFSAAAFAAGSTVEAVLAAWLVRRYAGGRHAFERVGGVLAFAGLAALLAPMIGATIALAGVRWRLDGWFTDTFRIWLIRWLGHGGGIMVIAPLVLLWADGIRMSRLSRNRVLEPLLLGLAVVAASEATFGVPFHWSNGYPSSHIYFPILAWTAFRLNPRATAITVVAASAAGVWGTVLGNGPFAVGELAVSLLLLQAFLIFTSATSLTVAVAVQERQRARRELYRATEEERWLRDRLLSEEQRRRTEAELAEDRAIFLNEAGILLGSSLDAQKALQNLAQLAVPRMADWTSVHMVMPDGAVKQVAIAHSDPGRLQEVQELFAAYTPDPDAAMGSRKVIRTGEPDLVSDIPDEMLAAVAQTPRHLELLRSLGFRSFVCVPLRVHDRVIGAMTFVSTRDGRSYGKADLDLAQELANRAAIAVENARLYAQAQEAVRIREDFLSIASHELRTPLTSLRLQIQVIERSIAEELAAREQGLPDGEASMARVATQVRTLREQSRRFTDLVNGLFDVTGITAGKLELQLREADFREIVLSAVAMLRTVAAEKQVELVVEAPQPLPGRWDQTRIEQVLVNLLSNAIKYGLGKPVTVRVVGGEEEVAALVCDLGPGIAREYHDRVFERFERVPGAEASSGLGLGLYIARQIAEAHGGTITIDSEPGCGATFTVVLPRWTRTKGSGEGTS